MTLKFEITIPVYNEAETVQAQLTKLDMFLGVQNFAEHQFTIVVADNGSSDNTGSIVKKMAELYPRISYVKIPKKGVGAALKNTWSNSGADVVGYMDLDLATDLYHLKDMVELFCSTDCDIVNASRLLPTSVVANRRFVRKVTTRLFNLLLRMIFKLRFTDAMCGFKFLKKSVFLPVLNQGAKSDKWFFSTQVLIISEAMNFHVAEIAVKWTDDQKSKVKVFQLSLEYLKEIFELRKTLKGSNLRKCVRL